MSSISHKLRVYMKAAFDFLCCFMFIWRNVPKVELGLLVVDVLGVFRGSRVLQRNQWNADAPGRASVPRATGPARGTESQCFSFGERFALEKFNAHRLECLVRTLSLRVPEFALGYFESFLFFVLIPLVSWKNQLD
jgi:hypothetical protein